MLPHPALLSPHSLFGGREKGEKRKRNKKMQKDAIHPVPSNQGKRPPQKCKQKISGANAPKACQEVCSSSPHQQEEPWLQYARDPPLPPYPPNRPPPLARLLRLRIGRRSWGWLAGGLAQSLLVKGLPDSGLSAGGSRAKKKPTTRSGAPSRQTAPRPVRIRRPNCVFGVRRWRNSSGSAAWRARTRKRICRRFAALGSRAVGLFGEAGVGVAIFKRAPEGMPGALGRGAGAEKKGKDFALARAARPRVCTRSACPSRQRGPCLTRRRPSASPSPGRRVAARSGSQTGP